ncbi:Pentatricopeptide repeat-containing protein At1g77360, mitochondrial [Linum grandiflorum]
MAAENGITESHRHHNGHIHRDAALPVGKQHASSDSPSSNRHQSPGSIRPIKRQAFPSYTNIPNLPSKIKHLCTIIATTPSSSVEKVLDGGGGDITQVEVEQVLKLSYSFPAPAVKFFRWSGLLLNGDHSAYAWNLVVDLLGKNCLFDAMWDAVKSMRRKRLTSLATFTSIFSSYVIAGKVKEAIMTFEVMDQYECNRDVVALNSLLSAVCRDGKTLDASEFLRVARRHIRPDSDSYAILLEGWEKEMNVVCARETFAEMIEFVGWDPRNVPAYDAFLCTLLLCSDRFMEEALRCLELMKNMGCCPGLRFLASMVEECCKNNDFRAADSVWETMVNGFRIRPDERLYSLMIDLHCCCKNTDRAVQLFDEMGCRGLFPDVQTSNLLFKLLISSRRLKEASGLLDELVRNECILSRSNCSEAVRVYLESGDAYMAILVWKLMVASYDSDLEETGNALVAGLADLQFVQEAVVYAESMIEKGMKLTLSTVSRLKERLTRERKEMVFEELLKKWTGGLKQN